MIRRIVLAAAFCVAAAAPAPAQVKLEYKFKEGRSASFQVTTKVKQTLTLKGIPVETAVEEAVTGTSSAGRRAEGGALPITQKIDQIRIELTITGQTVSFDTADPHAKIHIPHLAFLGDLMKAVVGQEFTIVLDAQNRVKEVRGLDQILDQAKDLGPKALHLLKERLSADRITRHFEKAHANLPDILVREGEPWELTEVDDIGGGQTLTFRRKYEYLGTVNRGGKTLDQIGITALDVKYAQDPEAKTPLKAVKSDLKVESSKGAMLFDREEGVVVERHGVTRITGTIDFKVGFMNLPGTLDLTLDSTIERGEPEKAAK